MSVPIVVRDGERVLDKSLGKPDEPRVFTDLPAKAVTVSIDLPPEAPASIPIPADVWRELAEMCAAPDQAISCSLATTTSSLSTRRRGRPQPMFEQSWQQWASKFPEAIASRPRVLGRLS
jgi:hypothetical protein